MKNKITSNITLSDIRVGNLFTGSRGIRPVRGFKDSYVYFENNREEDIRINIEKGIDEDYIPTIGTEPKFCIPVPITESWLERLGFVRINPKLPLWGFNLLGKEPLNFDEWEIFIQTTVMSSDPVTHENNLEVIYRTQRWSYKYVHQIQNLYHGITGMDLIINELTTLTQADKTP